MGEFLVFTLAGPFASFGEVAGNERRSTRGRPGHSMLVGLIAAALGIKREETERLQQLSNSCRFAVRTDRSGGFLVDYHTIQSAKRRRNFAPATRKQMLEEGDQTTIITRREYLMDVHFTVALSLADEAGSLADICGSLITPKFSLYLGRRACPPSLPLMPVVIGADKPQAAFALYDAVSATAVKSLWPAPAARNRVGAETSQIAVDNRLLVPGQARAQPAAGRLERRRTLPVDRNTWRFDTLDELVLTPDPAPPAKEER